MKDIPYLQNMGISPFPQNILKRSGRMGERQTLKSQTERDSLSWKQSITAEDTFPHALA